MSWFKKNKPKGENPEKSILEEMERLENEDRSPHEKKLSKLVAYLNRLPGTQASAGRFTKEGWHVSLLIDIDHSLAWNVVQELGFFCNSPSIGQGSGLEFFPISPPPYLNGGPREFLSWTLSHTGSNFSPSEVAKSIEGVLPQPVEDEAEWPHDE